MKLHLRRNHLSGREVSFNTLGHVCQLSRARQACSHRNVSDPRSAAATHQPPPPSAQTWHSWARRQNMAAIQRPSRFFFPPGPRLSGTVRPWKVNKRTDRHRWDDTVLNPAYFYQWLPLVCFSTPTFPVLLGRRHQCRFIRALTHLRPSFHLSNTTPDQYWTNNSMLFQCSAASNDYGCHWFMSIIFKARGPEDSDVGQSVEPLDQRETSFIGRWIFLTGRIHRLFWCWHLWSWNLYCLWPNTC